MMSVVLKCLAWTCILIGFPFVAFFAIISVASVAVAITFSALSIASSELVKEWWREATRLVDRESHQLKNPPIL